LVDLAADLQWALQLPADALLLDRHLAPPATPEPIGGLPETSVVQRALGALLAQGRTPEAAAQDLQTIADRSGVSVPSVARDLVRPPNPRSTRADTPTTRELDFAALRFGLPWDGTAQPGDHICALYRGPDERTEQLTPYLHAGLHAGDKCLCLINPPDSTVMVNRLATDSTIADHLDSDQLEIRTPTDVYLPAGEFLAEQMTGFLANTMSAAETAGYPRFRAAGDMSWLQDRPPGIDQYLGYESNLNRITRHPTLMCMYDLGDLDQDLLNDLLRTHPTVLHNGQTMPSPYYQDPDEYSAIHA